MFGLPFSKDGIVSILIVLDDMAVLSQRDAFEVLAIIDMIFTVGVAAGTNLGIGEYFFHFVPGCSPGERISKRGGRCQRCGLVWSR
jgi:hypothetical protein